jgi:hypothetical protein
MTDEKKDELLAIQDIAANAKREAMALRLAIAGLIHSDVGSDNTYVEAVEERAISLIDNIQDLSDKLDYLRGEETA